MLSCGEREIAFCDRVRHERDSLERLLHLTRSMVSRNTRLGGEKYYIIGSESDLVKKGIIKRVSGISMEFKLCNDFPKHHFICVDDHAIDSVVVYGKYVRIVGRFNPDYYTITGCDKDDHHVMRINDKVKFWAENVYLVITHK